MDKNIDTKSLVDIKNKLPNTINNISGYSTMSNLFNPGLKYLKALHFQSL